MPAMLVEGCHDVTYLAGRLYRLLAKHDEYVDICAHHDDLCRTYFIIYIQSYIAIKLGQLFARSRRW